MLGSEIKMTEFQKEERKYKRLCKEPESANPNLNAKDMDFGKPFLQLLQIFCQMTLINHYSV